LTKFKIALIGAGKLAFSLTPALIKSGYKIDYVVSNKHSSAKILAEKCSIHQYSNSLKKIPDEVNVFFITVPDGEIKKTSANLAKIKKDFSDSIFIHFSGVENISVLKPL